MNSGRHFSPPTPAFRPQDPFSNMNPRSAERIPSCEAVTPPPFRPRPVRIDPTDPKDTGSAGKEKGSRKYIEPQGLSAVVSRPIKKGFSSRRSKRVAEPKFVSAPAPIVKAPKVSVESSTFQSLPVRDKLVSKRAQKVETLPKDEEVRKCEWARCENTFVVKLRGHAVVRRYCSATCRGRASEARTGKRTGEGNE